MPALLYALACGGLEVSALTYLLTRVLHLGPCERRATLVVTWCIFSAWCLVLVGAAPQPHLRVR